MNTDTTPYPSLDDMSRYIFLQLLYGYSQRHAFRDDSSATMQHALVDGSPFLQGMSSPNPWNEIQQQIEWPTNHALLLNPDLREMVKVRNIQRVSSLVDARSTITFCLPAFLFSIFNRLDDERAERWNECGPMRCPRICCHKFALPSIESQQFITYIGRC